MMQRPHVKHIDTHWRIKLLQILQEVRRICKTRNQLKRNSRSTWGFSSSFTTCASEAKRCWARSLSYSSQKTLESNKSVKKFLMSPSLWHTLYPIPQEHRMPDPALTLPAPNCRATISKR